MGLFYFQDIWTCFFLARRDSVALLLQFQNKRPKFGGFDWLFLRVPPAFLAPFQRSAVQGINYMLVVGVNQNATASCKRRNNSEGSRHETALLIAFAARAHLSV